MSDKIVIDAKDAILGRLSAYIAKQVLLGNKVDVVNCEECVVSGKKHAILDEYMRRLHRKAPTKAPFSYRMADAIVKRTIRGMLPFKRARGREAFKSIKCHIGVPESLRNERALTIENASSKKLGSTDYLKMKDICRAIGGK